MKLVNAFARPWGFNDKLWKAPDHGWTLVFSTTSRDARDMAIDSVHADAKKLGKKVRTEKISPTRFEVHAAKPTLRALFAEVSL